MSTPSGTGARAETPPDDWDVLLLWWDERVAAMTTAFETEPQAPAWLPFADYPQQRASWIRRQAHEAAIHRVDAELAAGRDPVRFDPDFAADGVDELLMMMLPSVAARREPPSVSGEVLFLATDIDRRWSVRLRPGAVPSASPGEPDGWTPDVIVSGPATEVYLRVWDRPSAAVVTGDVTLLTSLAAP